MCGECRQWAVISWQKVDKTAAKASTCWQVRTLVTALVTAVAILVTILLVSISLTNTCFIIVSYICAMKQIL